MSGHSAPWVLVQCYCSGGSRTGAEGGHPSPLIWERKEITEERKTGKQNTSSAPTPAQGLDPPLHCAVYDQRVL